VLAAHPAVAQAAVFGVPSALLGEMVAAALVLRQETGGAATSASLISWCQERLAHYKVPAQVSGRKLQPPAPCYPH
jgi:acyl-coenzyme A synthetase/AMP-(fatty) acid ligase